MVMECRGLDDPKLPQAKQLSPETCWTGSVAERSQVSRAGSDSSWIHDLYAAPARQGPAVRDDAVPGHEACPTASIPGFDTHLTPFRTAKGKIYPACDTAHMPPEAAVGAAFPPNEIAAFTDLNGRGSVQFEVRTERRERVARAARTRSPARSW